MNEEIRVREAFKIGMAMNIERVAILYDNALEAGLLPKENGTPIDKSLAGYITLPEKSPEKSSRVKKAKNLITGYFEEAENWLETSPLKDKAQDFIKYLAFNPDAKLRASVTEIDPKFRWIKYRDANGVEKEVDLNAIGKVLRGRKN
jgi:hypothetical protein